MTSQEYADMVVNGTAPWMEGSNHSRWSDSTKEQYFNFLTAEQSNEMELERWRLNNEYNTPRAQMMRMIEAGMNPAAAYQQINSGNSSSAPDTHQPGTAAFHDTSDKLQRINTIMNGISSIMNTIYGGIDAVRGIQDIQFGYQNNWLDKYRADNYKNLWITNSVKALEDRYGSDVIPYEIAPGIYAPAAAVGPFKDILGVDGFNTMSRDIAVREGNLSIQDQLAERRTRIDNLIQSIMHGLESNASNEQMIKLFMQLFMYGAMSKFGGF